MDTHWVGTVSTGNLSEADQAAVRKVRLATRIRSTHTDTETRKKTEASLRKTLTQSPLCASLMNEWMQVLEPMRCHPIFIPEELIQGHYHGYCKTVMWPLFHNVEMLDSCGCVPGLLRLVPH